MKNVLLLFALSLALSSCGTMQKAFHRSSDQVKTDSTVKTHVSEHSSSTAKSTATAKTTTKEKADTNVTVPGNKATVTGSIKSLEKGDTLHSSSSGTSVTITYDPTTGTVHGEAITAPHSVPIRIDRETTIIEEKRADIQTNATTEANTSTHTSADKSNTQTDKEIHRAATHWYFSPWPYLAIVILIVLFFIYKRLFPIIWGI